MPEPVDYSVWPASPVGPIWAAGSAAGLTAVAIGRDENQFVQELNRLTGYSPRRQPNPLTAEALAQLQAYFAGQQRDFDLPIDWSVFTPFQAKSLRLVQAIPFGKLRTYGDLAVKLGQPGAARAVGRANATNPIPIIIPCHRVIGSTGKLHGYGAGLEVKAWLLRHEGSWLL